MIDNSGFVLEKRKLTRKAKTIILFISFLVFLAIVTIVAVVLIKNIDKNEDFNFDLPKTFYYGATINVPLKVDSTWVQGLKFNDFDVVQKGSLVVMNSDYILDPQEEGQTELKILYDNKVIAVYIIDIFSNPKYISSADDFKSIEKYDLCIQTQDFIVKSNTMIDDFSGKYYGNYFAISGLDVSNNSGLFNNLLNARISGVKLDKVQGKVTDITRIFFGALVNNAYASHFYGIEASGSISFELPDTAIFNIGSLFGTLEYDDRTTEYLNATDPYAASDCLSQININIKTNGKILTGGIVGSLVNLSIKNCTYSGIITIANYDDDALEMTIGGIVGYVNNRVPIAGLLTNEFINGDTLINDGSIIIKDILNKTTNKIGGIFGEVLNTSITNCEARGLIEIISGSGHLYAGGIIGYATKSDSVSTLNMYIEKSIVEGVMDIFAKGTVHCGGIAGFASNMTINEDNNNSGYRIIINKANSINDDMIFEDPVMPYIF
ncbi:MAG: hypothetical protein LBF68_03880 [Christensenellaceae bacterium]|jgi:hypothetical protein|nr:hypothetical protein [Christensenellaceae bacterium]